MAEPGTDEGHGRLQITPKLLNMIYKITTSIFALACIYLGTRLNVLNNELATVKTDLKTGQKILEELEHKNSELNKLNDLFLKENADLITANNELKFIQDKKPLIIYRNEKNRNVNRNASEQYNELLTKRYELE